LTPIELTKPDAVMADSVVIRMIFLRFGRAFAHGANPLLRL
jgi:hypothetical protein